MHPTDSKSIAYGIVVFILAVLVNIFCISQDFWFIPILFSNIILLIIHYKTFFSYIVLVSLASIANNLILVVLLFIQSFIAPDSTKVFVVFGSLFFTIYGLIMLKHLFDELIELIKNEKINYHKIKYYPNLICGSHLSRFTMKTKFGFKSIYCRVNEDCLAKNMVKVEKLVGLIGKDIEPKNIKNNYFVTIWNIKNDEIIPGDYDIIEIHENQFIEDYDKWISKIVSYFYNEVDRFKPINKVEVRIIGHPKLSENTKRLLAQNFLKVEYASN